MRILFMGTPDFAVASLKRLVEDGHDVCGVFTQPDKPKNRGHKMAFSPVKEYALTVGIPVYQPVKLRDGTVTYDTQTAARDTVTTGGPETLTSLKTLLSGDTWTSWRRS